MKTTKRLLAVLLCAGMLLSLLAACGSDSSETSSEETEETEEAEEETAEETEEEETEEAEEESEESEETAASDSAEEEESSESTVTYPIFDEPTTFTLWVSNSPDLSDIIEDINDYLIFEQLEEITNICWDVTMVSNVAADTVFPLMVASGEYTDVVARVFDYYTGSKDQAIEDEFLIDLSDLIDENMPNLSGWFETYSDLRKDLLSDEGYIVAFPKIYLESSDITSGGCIRADWLEELGMDNPTTYDELYEVLVAFRDELGAEEPLVISVSTGIQSDLLNGYNINAGFYQIDDEILFGAMQPEFKEYLTMMNQWYEEGLFSQDFLSATSDVLLDTDTILSGDTGVWYGTSVQTITTLLSMTDDPDMSITGVTYVTTDGSIAHVGEEGSVFDSNMWSITTACEDPAAICQYIDYVYSDAGILLANYGVEGETFEYDEDGTPVLTELVTNNPDLSYTLALNVYTCDRQTPIPFVIDEDKARADYTEDQLSAVEIWSSATDGLYNLPKNGINMTTDETTEYNTIYSDIDTYIEESVAKFIVGDTDLDEFDNFVDTLITMGIEDCIALYQAAYDRYLAS